MLPFERVRAFLVVLVLTLTACSGGTVSLSREAPASAGIGTMPASTQSVTFVFTPTAAPAASVRRPRYVGAGTKSVAIVVDSVNGIAVPPASYATHTNVSLANCPCAVSAVVPPGNDVFTVTTYDGPYANGAQQGKVISLATTPTTAIGVGTTNGVSLTLDGRPASFTIAGLPANPQAGTAIAAVAFTVIASDVDGHTIIGTYANPVTISTSDASGATTLATSGSDAPPAGTLLSSGDVATIAYSGLAIASSTIAAGASGATSASAIFAPKRQPIVIAGAPLVDNAPSFMLNQITKTGTFTATEAGWTNAPYDKTLTIVPGSGCGSVGSIAQGSSNTAFNVTEASSPAVGSCTITLDDVAGGSTSPIAVAYNVHGTIVYGYTGGPQTYTVPSGVTSITVSMSGAAGGLSNASSGGSGGSLTAQLPVTPNVPLSVLVGGAGASTHSGTAGYNGGGKAGTGAGTDGASGGGGGGASSLLDAGVLLAIAGGGGGSVVGGGSHTGQGGSGGHVAGAGASNGGQGGGAATLAMGGSGGDAGGLGSSATNGTAGVANVGGTGGNGASEAGGLAPGYGGGGGGGGYFGGGGGGGGDGDDSGAGGGGTSNVLEAGASGVAYTDGNNGGNGSITITW